MKEAITTADAVVWMDVAFDRKSSISFPLNRERYPNKNSITISKNTIA
jgi:hypothetical protein